MRRVARKGFMQQRIYPLFGYYPWHCSNCRTEFMLRKKNHRRRRKEFKEGAE